MIKTWHWYDRFGRKEGTGKATPGKNYLGEEPHIGQTSHNSFVVADEDGFIVARVSNALVTMSADESEARAKLFAASPNLLAVCQWILARWELEPESAVFPAHAYRADLKRAVEKAL